MSAYDNDPRVTRNPDGSVRVTVVLDPEDICNGGSMHVTFDPAHGSVHDLDEAIRSLIGDPQ